MPGGPESEPPGVVVVVVLPGISHWSQLQIQVEDHGVTVSGGCRRRFKFKVSTFIGRPRASATPSRTDCQWVRGARDPPTSEPEVQAQVNVPSQWRDWNYVVQTSNGVRHLTLLLCVGHSLPLAVPPACQCP